MGNFRLLVDILPQPVLFVTVAGDITFYNKAFEQLSGINPEPNVNRKIFDFFTPGDQDIVNNLIRNQKLYQQPTSVKLHLNHNHLMNTEVKLTVTAEGEDGKISGFSCLIEQAVKPTEVDAKKNNSKSQPVIEIEEKYKKLYDLTFEGIIIHQKGIILDANPAFAKMMGYSPVELIGKNIIDLCVLPEYHEIVYNSMKNEVTAPYEVMAQRKNGAIIHTEVESRRIDLNDEIVRVSAMRDITARKLGEAQLKESEERYKLLSNITFEGIFLHKKGVIFDANQSLANMIGYSLEEIAGENIIDLVVVPEYHQRVYTALVNEETTPYEVKVKRKDGSLFFAEVEARMINYGGELLRVTAARDITWRKETARKLRENEEELDTFFSQSGDGFFIMNMNKPVTWDDTKDKEKVLDKVLKGMHLQKINEAMLAQYRTTRAKISEYNLERFFQWNDIFGRNFIRELLDKGSLKFEMAEPRFDKSIMWIEGNYVVLYDENRKVRGCCGVRREISDRKKTEEAIKKHNEELKKANQELDNFVYRVSHDLKAPISSAKGLIHIAQKENEIARVRTCLELLENSMDKLDSFILDILDYSRNSRLEIEPQLIDFESLVKDTLSNTRFLQLERNIEIETVIKDDVDFFSDRRRLVFIFNNLISNAIRFSDRKKRDSFLHISIEVKKQYVQINFSDNGIGIKSEHLKHIFNMFYRATEEQVGSGLGLYIVKEALDRLHGEIKVKSEFGEGTRFYLKIPNLANVEATQKG
jgi:PAS domain S-box-containing protein